MMLRAIWGLGKIVMTLSWDIYHNLLYTDFTAPKSNMKTTTKSSFLWKSKLGMFCCCFQPCKLAFHLYLLINFPNQNITLSKKTPNSPYSFPPSLPEATPRTENFFQKVKAWQAYKQWKTNKQTRISWMFASAWMFWTHTHTKQTTPKPQKTRPERFQLLLRMKFGENRYF